MPAKAEIFADIAVKSDNRFHGRSLSGGQPVVEGDIGYDTDTGLYLGAAVTWIVGSSDRAGLQGVEGHIGYATQIDDSVAVDVGVAGYAFTNRYSGNRDDAYVGIYAGASAENVSVYLHYTANYFGRSVPVVYADISMAKPIGDDFSLKARAGLLVQTSGVNRLGGSSARYDTQLALSRVVRGVDVAVSWTFAGPGERYFGGPWDGRSAVTLSLAKHF